ncbi:hypothetical protein MHM93_14600 [Pseudoalteromonas sp. MM17-2]|uniref:hypothetical protein n=1 Tax=Pseudoalteromonas sp. MM17-2 TaxID=2917753 RepID=UPI001EF5BF14|nr:hypothetical protein [Pseudoalteromonas sp. MM17-2]MCG7545408.1 hypothetical protein [Pseudoalteromonas sp. MM17-2]
MSKSANKHLTPVIEKGIPIPPPPKPRAKDSATRINWPFSDMEHGDSFLIPAIHGSKKAHAALGAMKRRNQIEDDCSLITRLEGESYRVWFIKKV